MSAAAVQQDGTELPVQVVKILCELTDQRLFAGSRPPTRKPALRLLLVAQGRRPQDEVGFDDIVEV